LGDTKDVGSRFHVLRSRTHFGVVPRATCPVIMFCVPGLVFGGTKGAGSHSHVLHYRTRFWRYRWCRAPFSCFTLPNSFLAVPRASSPVFMFCSPGLVLSGTEGVRCRFHILRSRTHFRRYRGRRLPFLCFALSNSIWAVSRASGPDFMLCAPGPILGGPVLMFCAPGLILGGIECFRSCFHVLHSRTRLGLFQGRRVQV
jgi:hypothetical protein